MSIIRFGLLDSSNRDQFVVELRHAIEQLRAIVHDVGLIYTGQEARNPDEFSLVWFWSVSLQEAHDILQRYVVPMLEGRVRDMSLHTQIFHYQIYEVIDLEES